ncbi:MAG: flagellar hook-length control protein FliK [Pseudobutyrivibrio sp.]|nr:flagellar hook-length control protein FliK [Pseudobutyrivibrio sp.]
MTNATNNVSGMLMSPQVSNPNFQGKTKEEPVVNTSFVSVYNNTIDNMNVAQNQNVVADSVKEVADKEGFEGSSKTVVKSKPKSESARKESGTKEIAEKLEKAGDEIKEVISSELDISKEDIEKAMEVLGLTVMDLVDPANLAMLLNELNGNENPISLVFNDEINSVLKQVTEIINQLTADNEISFEEIKNILEGFEVTEPENFENELMTESESPVEAKSDVLEFAEESVAISKETAINTDVKKDNTESVEKTDISETYKTVETVVEVEEEMAADNKDDFSDSSDNFDGTENTPEKTDKAFKPAKPEAFKMQSSFNETAGNVSEVKAVFEPLTETVQLPSGESVRVQELIDQVVEQAKVINTSEKATIEMTLNPEGLGKVFVEVTQKGDEIIAKLHAQNDAVKQALESQMANLKLEVNNSATKITSVEVSVGTHEFERNLEEGQQNRDHQQEDNQSGRNQKRTRIDLNNLDELTGLMSEEERLVAQIMKDNGNSLNYQV